MMLAIDSTTILGTRKQKARPKIGECFNVEVLLMVATHQQLPQLLTGARAVAAELQ